MRDEASAKVVNVTPSETPQDIYQLVADALLPRLTADAATDPLAALWLSLHEKTGLVDRKFAKRPAMTFFYGSKLTRFRGHRTLMGERSPDAETTQDLPA